MAAATEKLLETGEMFLKEILQETETKYKTSCLIADSSKCPGEIIIISHKLLSSLKKKFSKDNEDGVMEALNCLICERNFSLFFGSVSNLTESALYIRLNRPIIFKDAIVDMLKKGDSSYCCPLDINVTVHPYFHWTTMPTCTAVSMETGRLLLATKLLSRLFNSEFCLPVEIKLFEDSPLFSSLLVPYEAQANLEILESLRKEFLRNLQPFCEESSSSFKVIAETFLKEKSLYGKSKFSRNIKKIEVETARGGLTEAAQLGINIYQTLTEKKKQETKLVISMTQNLAFITQQALVLVLMAASSKQIDLTSSVSIFEVSRVIYMNGEACNMEEYIKSRYQCNNREASGMKDFPLSLGDDVASRMSEAAIKFEMLSIPPKNPLKLDLSNVHFEGTFVLYNYARMATLERNFETGIKKGVYPSLPSPKDIDYSLLSDEDEWELLYSFILLYPSVLHDATKLTGTITVTSTLSKLPQFLIKLCHLFSSYYSRVRILLPPEPHLIPIIQARITLVLALKQVLFSGLQLLGISPLEQL